MKRYLFLFVLLSFLVSCGSGIVRNPNRNRKDIDLYYTSGGISQYYLPDMPAWANFSTIANCKRDYSIRYLNFNSLGKSFDFDYSKLIQMQGMINERLREHRSNTNSDVILPKDQDVIFYDVIERIRGGVVSFRAPDFNIVHLVWIDEFNRSPEDLTELQKLLDDKDFVTGYPVFVSHCLSQKEMEGFIEANNLENRNIFLISAEFFNPYAEDLSFRPGFYLNFNKLFKPQQRLFFYTKRDYLPEEFQGQFILQKVKR